MCADTQWYGAFSSFTEVLEAYVKLDKEKRFFDTRWPANKNVRSMVIFFQNPETGRIGLDPITDIIAGAQSFQPEPES